MLKLSVVSGENIILRVAFKPTDTIRKEQKTVTREGEETLLAAKGRRDPYVLPRAVPMMEVMVALVLCDHLLHHHGQCKLVGCVSMNIFLVQLGFLALTHPAFWIFFYLEVPYIYLYID